MLSGAQSESDPGVSGSRLNDNAARFHLSRAKRIFNEHPAQPVFNASARIHHLKLSINRCSLRYIKMLETERLVYFRSVL